MAATRSPIRQPRDRSKTDALDPDDVEQLADAVADRVAQRLREQPSTRFVDAATLARVLGVKRSWVYQHA